ncbi:MAG: polyprenyl synthetase family protein [Hyphomonadaceae bacterium]|nr:polyprenyl synthetase family protein [Hyphomonadaceae bacterium]
MLGPAATPEARASDAASAPDALAARLGPDLAIVDAIIHERLSSNAALIPNLAAYLIDAGGKRVRPMITLAAAHALGGPNDATRKLSAAVEFIHTATLLHDDVVDESALRRGRTSAHRVWGRSASVLVGDFLFARAFNLMVEADDLAVLDVLARASSVIAEGEVLQLSSANDAETTLDHYMQIISAKTAALFAAAARVGAMSVGASPVMAHAFDAYGRNVGLAFQLVDDALDYGGAITVMGKNTGDDFREGKITLPVILARETGDAEERAFWARAMGGGVQEPGDFERALVILRRRNAITRTLDFARVYAKAARDALADAPETPWRAALIDLADFVVDRVH